MNLTDDERRMLLHELLNMGENMLSCGGEVSRVEETLSLMGKAYGAERTNVFCITSSMVLTIQFPIRQELTQTRRLSLGANDFVKLERYNDLSRHCCEKPLPVTRKVVRSKSSRPSRDVRCRRASCPSKRVASSSTWLRPMPSTRPFKRTSP